MTAEESGRAETKGQEHFGVAAVLLKGRAFNYSMARQETQFG